MLSNSKNIVLIGMPGSGKSTIAKALAILTGRLMIDSDEEILRRTGFSPKELILTRGEPAFREIETEVIRDLGKREGIIIATGGGVVTVRDNYELLHQNGCIIYLTRALEKLADKDRPISQRCGVEKLFMQREPLYKEFADYVADNDENAENVAGRILSMIS